MKEVIKKDLPDVSGGSYQPDEGGCIPGPKQPPFEVDWGYPTNPVVQGPDVGA